MILIWLISILFIGGILAWGSERYNENYPRNIALLTVLLDLILMLSILPSESIASEWITVFQIDWIPRFGISLYFALDGLSLLLIILTAFLGAISIGSAWNEIKTQTGFFYFNLIA